jgi:nickel transport protein
VKRVYVILFFLSVLFLLLGRNNHVFAHGVNYSIDQAKVMVIRVTYDDGEPMSYAEVKIFSPDNQQIEYQRGRTDKKGQFPFLPDKGGEWKVIVNDGMGHGVVAKVSPDNKAGAGSPMQSSGFKKWQKAVMAFTVVWGFIGLAFYLQARTIKRK